jgi:hypothetical protein
VRLIITHEEGIQNEGVRQWSDSLTSDEGKLKLPEVVTCVITFIPKQTTYTYVYGNNSRRITSASNAACKGETKYAYRVLVWKPEGQKKIRSRNRRWEDNIKTVLK